jgi:electron-transferring-flavoprotein dehydrogenase
VRLAAAGDTSNYNSAWKQAIEDELVRNVTMADMARDYGPEDWDWVFGTANEMLAGSEGVRMYDRKLTAGVDAVKLLGQYRLRKFGFRGDRYVQLHESEYTV